MGIKRSVERVITLTGTRIPERNRLTQAHRTRRAQVFGIVGNPVAHSRSPALHNAALAAAGLDAVYVPLLVDELRPFLAAFPLLSGLSVTIPHKVSHGDACGAERWTPSSLVASQYCFVCSFAS
jgi:hypothetical protein